MELSSFIAASFIAESCKEDKRLFSVSFIYFILLHWNHDKRSVFYEWGNKCSRLPRWVMLTHSCVTSARRCVQSCRCGFLCGRQIPNQIRWLIIAHHPWWRTLTNPLLQQYECVDFESFVRIVWTHVFSVRRQVIHTRRNRIDVWETHVCKLNSKQLLSFLSYCAQA